MLIQCPDVIVLNGQTLSDPVIVDLVHGDAFSLGIQAPAVLAEVVTVDVSNDFNSNYAKQGLTLAQAVAAATWSTYQESGADFSILAGKAKITEGLNFVAWRIKLSVAATGQKNFKVSKEVFC